MSASRYLFIVSYQFVLIYTYIYVCIGPYNDSIQLMYHPSHLIFQTPAFLVFLPNSSFFFKSVDDDMCFGVDGGVSVTINIKQLIISTSQRVNSYCYASGQGSICEKYTHIYLMWTCACIDRY